MSLPVGLPAVADSDLLGQVARILTQAIVQGRLPPGSKVVEAGIARELGVSRAPVREAARLLEKQGLLVAKPRRGFFVRKLEIRNIDEIYDLRLCIERHAGVLAARNAFDPDRLVTDVIPEVRGTAYDGATIRHLLDMRAGIAFDEDYLATSGPIVAYRKAVNWNPLAPGETPTDLRSFYRELTKSSGPHGGPFNYVSPNTDLLGWVIERATGQRYVDVMSELLWRPLGAARSAYITVDRLGAPRCAGGVCTTVRDLARVGLLLVQGGARGSTPIVPERWIDDIAHHGDPAAWAAGNGSEFFPGLPLRYRSKWYVQDGAAPVLFGFGIHGQFLIVDRQREIVIAKVSSQALPIDVDRIAVMMLAVAAIIEFLAHL